MTGRATSVVLEWSDACSEPSADDGLAPDGGIVRHGVSGAPACRPPRVSHAPPTLTRPKAWTRLDRPGLGGSGRPNADEKNWGHMMPLHVGKFERFPSADRNELALAALEWCRAARASVGVKDSRFYWIDPNEIVVVTDAEPGAWGPGAGAEVSPQAAKAIFAAGGSRTQHQHRDLGRRPGRRRDVRPSSVGIDRPRAHLWSHSPSRNGRSAGDRGSSGDAARGRPPAAEQLRAPPTPAAPPGNRRTWRADRVDSSLVT